MEKSGNHLQHPKLLPKSNRFTKIIVFVLAAIFYLYLSIPLPGNPQFIPSINRQLFSNDLHTLLAEIRRDVLGEPLGVPTLYPNASHLHTGKHAMVACDVPLCSNLGRDILKSGGNAADAAVTVALCIGLINSHSSGIGGGGYITSFKRDIHDVISIDAREQAPAAAFKDMYEGQELLLKFGGLAVGIPGELKGLYELYRLHGLGNLSWSQLIEPVIKVNREGFQVGEVLARALKATELAWRLLRSTGLIDSWDFVYKNHSGKDLVEYGDFVKRPNLANTLEIIAKNGSSDVFYDPAGPIAPLLVKKIKELGGLATKEDFANYDVHITPALEFKMADDDRIVYTSGGSSLGVALISGLNFFTSLKDTKDPILLNHRIIESMKWIALTRLNLGDFSHNLTHQEEVYKKFTSAKWAQETIKKYDDRTTFPYEHYDPQYELTEPHGTLHFLVVDANGNAVGMTTTVNLLFGSFVYDNTTGVILNNEMDDFSVPLSPNAFNLTPSIFNYVGPFRRPLSSTSPTIIVKDGLPELVIGAAGGLRITSAVFHAIIRIIRGKLSLLETIAAPRLHHQLLPAYVMAENFTVMNEEFHDDVVDGLIEKNHTFWESGALTVMNGIHRVESQDGQGWLWEGVSDYWRKRGEASGY